MAGIDASEDNLDELIEAAMFESPPKQPSKSRKSRKAATKEKRYDTKIVSSDEEDAFDDYGDEEEFMSDDDEDDDDEDHDVDDDDDDDDDDGQRDTPTRSMSIESPQDVLSRDTLSAIAAATDESPDRILVRANGERQVVDVKKCLVAAGKVVDKIRTEDMTASVSIKCLLPHCCRTLLIVRLRRRTLHCFGSRARMMSRRTVCTRLSFATIV
jgi:hypothetical protein